jgi:predicted ATP-dependent endonuclease of OLD family
MHIRKCHVRSYKSSADTGEIEFDIGFNVLVGQNNAGKTASLEALSLFP